MSAINPDFYIGVTRDPPAIVSIGKTMNGMEVMDFVLNSELNEEQKIKFEYAISKIGPAKPPKPNRAQTPAPAPAEGAAAEAEAAEVEKPRLLITDGAPAPQTEQQLTLPEPPTKGQLNEKQDQRGAGKKTKRNKNKRRRTKRRKTKRSKK